MQTFLLGSCIVVLLLFVIFFAVLLFLETKKNKRFAKITNLEEHITRLNADATALQGAIAKHNAFITQQKQTAKKYLEAIGVLKSVAEAQKKQKELASEIDLLTSQLGVAKETEALRTAFLGTQKELTNYRELLGELKTTDEVRQMKADLEQRCRALRADLGQLEEAGEMQTLGIYSRVHDFESPRQYINALEANAAKQKDMIKAGRACTCAIEWTVDGSVAKGAKMLKEQTTLMLRAFNGEADAAISKCKPSNFASIRSRIEKAYDALNKTGQTKQLKISPEFLKLKLDELILVHECERAKEAEKERQKEIRDRLREEEKAAREIETARKSAEKEEQTKLKALEDARRLLAEEHGMHNAKLESLVQKLENELKEAIDRKSKAIARAQLTKSGHVYILSNIGTMGEGVYKIGMTRRFEPLDRVRELGDASVPFPFDVHALIYTDDAPKLEHALHCHFAERRLNLSNTRKEYFRVTLEEVHAAIKTYFGDITIRKDHEALQFRESLDIRQKGLASQIPVQEDDELSYEP